MPASAKTVFSRLAGALRGNLLFVVLFVAGVVLRVAVSLAYQPALLLQRDTYTYLNTALESSADGTRPALYPLILKAALVFHNLTVIAVVQHLIGLAIPIALYVLLRRLGVGPNLAALGAAPMLLDAYQIDIEQYVLTETFFELFVVGTILLIVWNRRPGPAAVAFAGVLLALAALTRFAGVALVAPVLVFVFFRLGWVRTATLLGGIAIPVVAYSLWTSGGSGSSGFATRNGYFLYGRVASFADCRGVDLPDELEQYCFTTPPEERGPSYGFSTLEIPKVGDKDTTNALLFDFSKRMILDQPLGYAGAVGSDLLRFFEASSPTSREPFARRWRFVDSVEDAAPRPLVLEHRGSPPPELGIDQRFSIDRPLAAKLRAYQDIFYTYGPLLAILIVLGFAGATTGKPRDGARDIRGECALLSACALALLLFPVTTTVWHFRYVLPALPLAGAGGLAGVSQLWKRYRRRSPPLDEEVEGPHDAAAVTSEPVTPP